MATVFHFLPSYKEYIALNQEAADIASQLERKKFAAALVIQKYTRSYLIRKWIAWLSYNATIIQCAFRCHLARKALFLALRNAVRAKHALYYATAATKIQALYRGHHSRQTKFCYYSFRRWLRSVTERGDRRAAEAAEFCLRSRADNLRMLEEEARQWLAFVVFKLHHLLRTRNVKGVYSDKASDELSEFEKLLKSIKYTEYMKRLRRKYEEFVRTYKPMFNNKRLFPIIGVGAEYWYLSLPEMYELTAPPKEKGISTRFQPNHHGKIHKEPFVWRSVKPQCFIEGRGPYLMHKTSKNTHPPPPTPNQIGDAVHKQDPRFNLYVKYYRPRPEVLEYIDYHINLVLRKKCEIRAMDVK